MQVLLFLLLCVRAEVARRRKRLYVEIAAWQCVFGEGIKPLISVRGFQNTHHRARGKTAQQHVFGNINTCASTPTPFVLAARLCKLLTRVFSDHASSQEMTRSRLQTSFQSKEETRQRNAPLWLYINVKQRTTQQKKLLQSKLWSARCVSLVSSGTLAAFSWDRDSQAGLIGFLSSSA